MEIRNCSLRNMPCFWDDNVAFCLLWRLDIGMMNEHETPKQFLCTKYRMSKKSLSAFKYDFVNTFFYFWWKDYVSQIKYTLHCTHLQLVLYALRYLYQFIQIVLLWCNTHSDSSVPIYLISCLIDSIRLKRFHMSKSKTFSFT